MCSTRTLRPSCPWLPPSRLVRLVHWLNQREADGPAFEVVAAALAITDGLRL